MRLTVHLIGEIVGATDFAKPNLSCKFQLLTPSDKWTLLEGQGNGQTQLSLANAYEDDIVVWNHPIDAYYTTTTLEGWPRIRVEVWHEDNYGRRELSGYGFAFIPSEPKAHNVECVLWKPQGSFMDRVYNFFFDSTPHLENKEIVQQTDDRFDLFTESVGTVHLRLEVVLRGFRNRGVSFSPQPVDEQD